MKYLKTIGLVVGLIVAGCGTTITSPVQSARDYAKNEVSESRVDVKSEVRNLSGFDKIDIGGTISADVTVGENFKVTVEAKEDILPKIITKVEDNTLKVNFEKNWRKRMKSKDNRAKVTISLPVLKDLDVSGASRASVTGVNIDKLTIDVSGASNVNIAGFARETSVDLSGASHLKAENLLSEIAEMDLSGASSAKVNVTRELRVDASGASSVQYMGEPRVEKDTSGASSVRRQ